MASTGGISISYLMKTWLIVIIFLIILSVLYGKIILEFISKRRRLYKLLDGLPGPYAIPILGSTWQFKWRMEELTVQMQGWARQFASEGHGMIVMWISFKPIVVCIRPETIKVILESNDIITKGPEYDILLPWLGTGLLIATGDKWKTRRRMLTPSFHFNVLNDFLITHDYQSKIFVEQLEKFAKTGEEFDIFPYIKRCALDIICETAMGCTVNAQIDHNNPYVISVQELNRLAFLYQRMPWMWFKPIWYGSGQGFKYDKHLKSVTDFTIKVIDEKIKEFESSSLQSANENKKKAFLDMLIEIRKEGNLSYEDIREEVDTFMFEGHDTTSASMGWTLWAIAHNPNIQENIFKEMDQIFGSSDRDCTNEDIKQMKYLDKCIKESLRMRPSVPNMTRSTEKDIQIGDRLIPAGTSILIPPMMIHMHEEFHSNPLLFDPERFNEENISARHPYSYIPFSAGPRNCIGQRFAIMEEKTMLSWFFRNYSITSDIPSELNIALPEIITRPLLGFPVRIKKRQHH